MSITVRTRTGALVERDDTYILADGEAFMVPLTMMDSKRGLIHDGNGGPVGQRPGFLVSDDEQAKQAVEAAYREYATTVSERWRRGPGQPEPARSAPPTFGAEPQRTFDSPQAAVADAYAEYNRTIRERWRK